MLATVEDKSVRFKNFTLLLLKGKPVHNEVSEDGKQNKVDLTRLIKTFTMDLVTEYNLEVCSFYGIK